MHPHFQNDDDVFYSKLEREHAGTAQYIARKDLSSSLRDPDCYRTFGIRHYAGVVAYVGAARCPPCWVPLYCGAPLDARVVISDHLLVVPKSSTP